MSKEESKGQHDYSKPEEYEGSYVAQSLVFVNNSDAEPGTDDELRITAANEASSFLWAAQWLDEHNEYFVTHVELQHDEGHKPRNTLDATRTLVIRVNEANERAPSRLGPWAHGVPPLE